MRRMKLILLTAALTLSALMIAAPSAAQSDGLKTLSGNFAVAYDEYAPLPALVALTDASGYFLDDPIYLPDPADQYIGSYRGNPGRGSYQISVPSAPKARAFDVTGGRANSNLYLFDVRLMSDVASRGYMVTNEDNIASSLQITIDFKVAGGNLIVYAGDDQQSFPTSRGADGALFTSDDPREALPQGWSVINLDSVPFKVNRAANQDIDLITTAFGDVNDYSNLTDCATLMNTLVDRVQATYPFTDLYKLDWLAIRAKVLPAAAAATSRADCERTIRDLGNAIPDGHVGYNLPALRAESAGSLGMALEPLTDGRIAVLALRANGPAARAGIQPGAIITAFNGKPVLEAARETILYTNNASTEHVRIRIQIQDMQRGPLGSTAEVTFENPGEAAQTVTLTRDRPGPVNFPREDISVRNGKLPSGIGYYRIEQFFGPRTLGAFDRWVDQMISENVPAIIIDIRDNPGGFSQMSDAMASRFFEEPFVVGRTYSMENRLVFMMRVEPRSEIYKGKVAVLVNENTSSSGDLFAYTMARQGRSEIVGKTPSGGLAGTVAGGGYYLPNGGFIQIPTGGLIDDEGNIIVEGTGVVPTILVEETVDTLLSPADEVLAAAEAALQ